MDLSADKAFLIIIPSYNNARYYEKNLGSVLSQNYDNYRVIYIDDASHDRTADHVQRYLLSKDKLQRVTFWQNKQNRGSLANIYLAASFADPHEIILSLDGDDWLFDTHVLEKLNAVYADEDVWMTYGQFVTYPEGMPGITGSIADEVISRNAFRDTVFLSSHLKTFYAGLFQKILLEDLLYEGNFFSITGDLAFMFPMLEMAGVHSRFIADSLYVYNTINPLSDCRKNGPLQEKCDKFIRKLPKYKPIQTPF